MAGRIIYHGECANPPHRAFLGEHLESVVKTWLDRGLALVDVVFIRPPQVVLSDARFDEIISESLESVYHGVKVVRLGSYDNAVHDGYVLALVDDKPQARWIYLTRRQLAGRTDSAANAISRLIVASMKGIVDRIIDGFPRQEVAHAGGV